MEYLIISIVNIFILFSLCTIYKNQNQITNQVEMITDAVDSLKKSTKKHDKAHDKMIKRIGQVKSEIKIEGINTYRQVVAAQRIDELIGPGYTLGLRGWPISPDALLEILYYIKANSPKVILELGSGRGTLAIDALIKKYKLKTKLISVDHLSEYLDKTRFSLSKSDNVELVLATLKHQDIPGLSGSVDWYDIEPIASSIKNQKVDLVIVDGPPESTTTNARLPVLRLLNPYLSKDAVFFLDDYNRPSEHEAIRDWLSFDKNTNPQVISIETEKGLALYKRKS